MSPKPLSVRLLLLAALAATSGAAPVLPSFASRQLDAVRVGQSSTEYPGVERREIDIGSGIIAGEAPSPSKFAEVSDAELGSRTKEERDWDPLIAGLGSAALGGLDADTRDLEQRDWNPLGGGASPKRRIQAAKRRESDTFEDPVADRISADVEARTVEERQWNSLTLADGLLGSDYQAKDKRQVDFVAMGADHDPTTSQLKADKRQYDSLELGVDHDPSHPLSADKRQVDFVALGADHDPSPGQLGADKRQWNSLELGTDHDPSHPLSADKREWNALGGGLLGGGLPEGVLIDQ